ncbi:MAG: ATP-binding protein [Bacillota bacterium]|nr:ATP-binding protein [Bacillota bacterium]
MIFRNEEFEIDEGSLLAWAEEWGISGDLRKKYILQRLIYSDNVLSRGALRGDDLVNSYLWQIAVKELETIKNFRTRTGIAVMEDYIPANRRSRWKSREEALYNSFIDDDPGIFLLNLVEYYKKRGYGDFAFYPFFRWDKKTGLTPIKNPDLVKFRSLVGYQRQKAKICRNTEGFLKGAAANNVLLYGERGTGKSSTIKAVGTRYYAKGLRMVEVDRDNLEALPEIFRCLEDIALRFIVYIDDLSFDGDQNDYKTLKAVLEGGLTKTRHNILIYATSNRRHLIKETWDERKGEEVNVRENSDELLSLSHRFGLSIAYMNPDQEEFLNIVEHLAVERGLNIPCEVLRDEALLWVRWQHNLSGRTAVQFINDMEIRESSGEFDKRS